MIKVDFSTFFSYQKVRKPTFSKKKYSKTYKKISLLMNTYQNKKKKKL